MTRLALSEGLHTIAGIRAMGVHAGIKKARRDMALIVSDVPGTVGAAVFTQNAFAAAPVHVSRQHVANGDVRAIVVNSGNANACTGRQGLRDALAMARTAATELGLEPEQVLVCSTGIIGRAMPMEAVLAGIHDCAKRLDNAVGGEAADAILTTDSGPKEAARTVEVDGVEYHVAGIAKGAGMIHPNMATMLALMATDAPVAAADLRTLLKHAVDRSFNQISVDGDESTNDTAILLANGQAGGESLTRAHPAWLPLRDALTDLCQELAKRIVADGEGATRLLEVRVTGAASEAEARTAARAVVSSNLVKAALHGGDPNWGRIVAALGQSRAAVDTAGVSLVIESKAGRAQLLADGQPVSGALEAARQALGTPEVTYHLHLAVGDGQASAWGCDLTEDYVSFNAEYST